MALLTSKEIIEKTRLPSSSDIMRQIGIESPFVQRDTVFDVSNIPTSTAESTPAFRLPSGFSKEDREELIERAKEELPTSEELINRAMAASAEAERGALRRFPGEFRKQSAEILQSISRNIASAGVTLAKAIAPKEQKEFVGPLTIESFQSGFGQEMAKRIFGEDPEEAEFAPTKSVERRVADAELKIQDFAKENKETNPRLSKFASSNKESLAFVGVVGMVGLDMTPFGGSSKNAFRAMKTTNTVGDALILLQKMGVADDLARNFADDVVNTKTLKEAENLFKSIANIQQTTRPSTARILAPGGRRTVGIPATRTLDDIPPELRPLAEEARKFDTAEEFVEAQISKEAGATRTVVDQNTTVKVDAGGKTSFERTVDGKPVKVGDLGDLPTETRREFIEARRNFEQAKGKGAEVSAPAGERMSKAKQAVDDFFFQGENARKSQLTDFFNRVEGGTTRKPAGNVDMPPVTSKTPPTPPQTTPLAFEVSNAMKVDAGLGNAYRQHPEFAPDFIANRTMPSGKVVPAIRKESGVFAPKDFETYDFKDISGTISGKRGLSFNFRDMALSADNLTARQASERGGFGPMTQLAYKHEEALSNRAVYVSTKAATVKGLADKHGVKINKKTGEELFRALEGKGASENVQRLANEIRDNVLNRVRLDANDVRTNLGKKEIGFLKNYAPHMQEVSFWRRLLDDGRTTITDNFDFIIPNAKKNPHAIPRRGQMKELKTNAWELIESYIDNVSNDIFISPQIEQIKAVGSVLRGRELFGISRFLDDYVRTGLVGKPGQFDSFFGLTEGSKIRTGLAKLNMARNISALAFNAVWTVFVQPASLVLTASRGGGVTRGLQNTIKGFWRFGFDTARNTRVRQLPTLGIKTRGASVGMTGAGDIDRMAGKIFKGKIESFNDVVGKLADSMEYWLTGGSMSTGYEEAAKLGLKGRDADIFANWLGGATQSQYNREARAMIMQNLSLRTGFPFSTYAFEVWRFAKTLVGKQGGMPLEKSQRLNQAIMLMAGAYVYNQYSEAITGRKLFTVGSGVPVIGGLVDQTINKGRVALGLEAQDVGGGRAPIAPQEDVESFIEAMGAYVNDNNFDPLRKELLKWGMGFSGIAGASTLNRFIDGMVASTRGYMTTKSGEPAFVVEGRDKIIAPLLGPWSTKAGKAYLNKRKEAEEAEKRVEPLFEEAQTLLEQGLNEEAQELVDTLSKDDWEIYKKLKSKQKAEDKAEGIKAMIPFVRETEELIEAGRDEDAQALVDSFTDQEYEWYEAAKDKLEKLRKAKEGLEPSFIDGEVLDDRTFVEVVATYAEALGTAPIETFDKLLAGETLRRVDNRAVIVFRMPFSESQAIREEWADGKNLEELRLDHIIPLQLGGTNEADNLRLVPVEIWEASTPIENHLGKLLQDGKIDKKKARQLILDFKEGRISEEDIMRESN